MTILDDAMRKHIEYIVCTERRPFSFVDFLTFEVDQQHYKMSHGTFRNKISAMLKREEVEVVYYSKQAFYTIKGVRFAKTMTSDHTGRTGDTLSSSSSICSPHELRCIKNHPVYRVIQDTPFDKSALHDIRLRTTVNGIWRLLSHIPTLSMNQNSKDILVIKEEINHLNIRVTVHHSDTISVVIGCSFSPVAVGIDGIIRLSNALTLIHDRLQRLVNDKKDCGGNYNDYSSPLIIIPNHMTWTVTMCHFGADSSIEYTGERFYARWEVAEKALLTFYAKVWKDGKCRIRGERQEYPGKPLDEALDEKLNLIRGVNEIVHS
jgi:hypothetical protein